MREHCFAFSRLVLQTSLHYCANGEFIVSEINVLIVCTSQLSLSLMFFMMCCLFCVL